MKQQVKRNIGRLPDDFMFELTKEEFSNLRSQFVTSSWGGIRYLPMAFTELVFNYLDELIEKHKNPIPRKQIEYKRQGKGK
ncbi:MAG: ORF6N domain-containing protein [Draconibacterium sp.]|nr:ORF6N domain-containing protein [Draconibacterium sp.]